MAFGSTLTLPVISGGSHNDFRVLLKTADFPLSAIDGGVASVSNGGGQLRAYLDDNKAIPLPLHVISFVTGTSPDILVRVRMPSISSGSTIYIERDATETSQPSISNAIGRNSVYPTATFATNQEEVNVVDSSGNHVDGTATANVTNVSGLFGRANVFNGSDTSIEIAGNLDLPADFTQSVWFKSNTSANYRGIIGDWGASGSENDSYLGLASDSLNWDSFDGSSRQEAGYSILTWTRFSVTRAGSTVAILKNGVQLGSTFTDLGGSSVGNSYIYIGALQEGGSYFFDGEIGHIELKSDKSTSDYLLTEYDNQSSIGSWVSVGLWVDGGGGSIEITGLTPNYFLVAISASIDLTGSIDVTGDTPNHPYSTIIGSIDLTGEILVTGNTPSSLYSALNGDVDLTGVINITGVTASYSYQAISGVIDLTGEITVLGATASYYYSAVNGLIELGALISVIGNTPDYNYQAISGLIDLAGEISITGNTPGYSYSAISGFVSIGEGQLIGVVTAGFGNDLYTSDFAIDKNTAGFKPSVITVNFKS